MRCCADVKPSPAWGARKPGCSVWGESDAWGCARDKTFAEAEAICQAAGARLCTAAELLGGCTGGTGCAFDSELVWGVPSPPVPPMPVECGKAGRCAEAAGLSRDPDELHEVRRIATHLK